jgi:hypothetical protein
LTSVKRLWQEAYSVDAGRRYLPQKAWLPKLKKAVVGKLRV